MRSIPPELGFAALVVAKDQPEYQALPAESFVDPRYGSDALVTRWRLDPDERARLAQPEIARALMAFAVWLAEPRRIPIPAEHHADVAVIEALRAFAEESGYDLDPRRGDDARVDLYHTQLLFGGKMQPIRMFFDSRESAAQLLGEPG